MARDEWYSLGQRFRELLLTGTEGSRSGAAGAPAGGQYASRMVDRAAGIVGQFNRAARLIPGNLLVVHLGRNACFQVDPGSNAIEYLFTVDHEQSPFVWRSLVHQRDGAVYFTISGAKDPGSATQDAIFGLAGAVMRLDLQRAEITAVATGDAIVDPSSLQVLDEQRFLVSDFGGFSGRGVELGGGSIYTVDRITGEVRVLASGGLLRDPVSAIMDDDGVIWVANAYMHYEYNYRMGMLERDDGEVLRIAPDGTQTVVLPRQSPAIGSIVGIHPSNDRGKLIVIRGDWPLMETGAVLLLDKATGDTETLLTARPGDPRFYSTHVDVAGDMLWVGESYQKQLLGYDLAHRAVKTTIDLSGILGAYRGVASSFEGIESVSVIPERVA